MVVWAVALLFMSVSASYSRICQSGGKGGGCDTIPGTEIKVKTIGRENPPHIVGNRIPSIIRESRIRSAGNRIPINTAQRVSKPLVQEEETYDFSHTLEGDWTNVVGYISLGGQGISLSAYFKNQETAMRFLEWFVKDEIQLKWA